MSLVGHQVGNCAKCRSIVQFSGVIRGCPSRELNPVTGQTTVRHTHLVAWGAMLTICCHLNDPRHALLLFPLISKKSQTIRSSSLCSLSPLWPCSKLSNLNCNELIRDYHVLLSMVRKQARQTTDDDDDVQTLNNKDNNPPLLLGHFQSVDGLCTHR